MQAVGEWRGCGECVERVEMEVEEASIEGSGERIGGGSGEV